MLSISKMFLTTYLFVTITYNVTPSAWCGVSEAQVGRVL